MTGYVFLGGGRARLQELPVPGLRPGEALVKVRVTSVCATDLKIVDGRVPAPPGTVLGHELVGEIVDLAEGVEGYRVGQRVLVMADTPCGQCEQCLSNVDGRGCHAGGSIGGFHLGLLRHGTHAEYVAVPFAQANLAPIPEGVPDEQAVVLACNGSAGFGGVEASGLRVGDVVAIVGQGPVGLAATIAARLRGAGYIIAIDLLPWRLALARDFGADAVLNSEDGDVVEGVRRLTGGWMADVAVEAVGTPDTFVTALRLVRPGGVLSSVGNYGMSGSLLLPLDGGAFLGGIGDKRIVTTASPGGKDRARRLLALLAHRRVDLSPFVTHRLGLGEMDAAYDLMRGRRERVVKVAVRPGR
jgi:alcohol dehydrogenase